IARIVPELRRMYGDIPAPFELPPEQERRYLFNSIRDFVARAADLRPLLLEHLAEALDDIPALVLGTYRDVELEVDRPLARSLESLLRRRLAERMSLKRLDEAGVAASIAALAGQVPPPEIVRVVFAETEGNAFFVEEVFEHLHEEGRLLDDRGEWRREVRVGEVDVPESVRLVIGRRLQRLSDEARKLLAAAATIGRVFDVNLLDAVTGGGEDELLDALEAAEAARLVSPLADDPARVEFSHELIRQTLLATLSTLRRQRLHRKVAEGIEARLGDRSEDRAEELVHHLLNAGGGADPERLLRYLGAAGERGMAAAAWEDALRHFENALTLVEGDRRARADLLVKLGFALRSVARMQDAAAAWREALDVYSEEGDSEAVAELCADLAFDLGYSGRTVEGAEFVQRGLVASEGIRNAARVRLLASGVAYLAWSGDRPASVEMEREALALARELGDPTLEAGVQGARATADYLYMDLRGTVEAARRSLELTDPTARPWERTQVLSLLEFAHLLRGESTQRDEVGEELVPLAERIGSGFALLLHHRAESFRDVGRTGDLRTFERYAREDLELCARLEQMWVAQSHTFLAMAAFWQGRWDEAIEHDRRGVEQELPGAFDGWSAAVLLLHLAESGQQEEAVDLWRGWKERVPSVEGDIPFGAWAMALFAVLSLSILGRREEVATLAPYAERALEEGTVLSVFGGVPVSMMVALSTAAAERWEEAESRFAEAMRVCEELPHRINVPEVRRFHAMALLQWGDASERDRARAMLERAREEYRSLGMPRHAEVTERLLSAPLHPA
ncbi:MAG TPA: hypothetical protein VG709_03295, partial [Actinomycetota bacterium]|nr:hypothetical protein [Actinomycetota bacterium]